MECGQPLHAFRSGEARGTQDRSFARRLLARSFLGINHKEYVLERGMWRHRRRPAAGRPGGASMGGARHRGGPPRPRICLIESAAFRSDLDPQTRPDGSRCTALRAIASSGRWNPEGVGLGQPPLLRAGAGNSAAASCAKGMLDVGTKPDSADNRSRCGLSQLPRVAGESKSNAPKCGGFSTALGCQELQADKRQV